MSRNRKVGKMSKITPNSRKAHTSLRILTQPVSRSVFPGQTATFSISVTGIGPFTYQWQKNGVNVGGATFSSYSLVAQLINNGETYRCVVSNTFKTTISSTALLTVTVASTSPLITTQPSNVLANNGQSVSFTVAASGTSPLSYQWQKNTVNIVGATSASYFFTAQAVDTGSSFRCAVTNGVGSANSNSASLTVRIAPAITSQPASQTIIAGNSVTFSVSATGTSPLSYQWQKNGVNVSLATGTSYSFTAQLADTSTSYRCVVTNAAGSITSNSAILTVNPASNTGATLLAFETFEANPCGFTAQSYFNGNALDTSLYSPNTVQNPFASSPAIGGSCSAHYFIKSGTDEKTPISLGRITPGVFFPEIYFEFYLYFVSPFPFAGAQKIARVGNQSGNVGPLIQITNQSNNANTQIYINNLSAGQDVFLSNGIPPFPLNQWTKLGLYFKNSGIGQSNGIARAFVNDVVVINSTTIPMTTTSNGWDYFWILRNYSFGNGSGTGGTTVAPFDGHLYLDSAKVYDTVPSNLPTS